MTKPDLVDHGAEEEVKQCLLNVRKPLRLGYAMVRCRNQRELDGAAPRRGDLPGFFWFPRPPSSGGREMNRGPILSGNE